MNELGGDPWILPIWSAVNDATRSGDIDNLSDDICQLGLWISIRLNILPHVIDRINKETKRLFKFTKKHQPKHIFIIDKNGYAFPDPSNSKYNCINNLKYKLIADIDSFLFELNSLCELMMKLFERLYEHAEKNLPEKNAGLSIKAILEEAGGNSNWFTFLDDHRNTFIHEATPYLAIDISESDNYDLLIMKENIKRFVDPEIFIRLSELNDIVQGFSQAKPVLQSNLISLFRPIPGNDA